MKKKYNYFCNIKENFDVKEKDVLCKYYVKHDSYCKNNDTLCPHRKINIFGL